MSETYSEPNRSGTSGVFRWIGRMIIISIILAIVSFLTPGFSIRGMWSYLFAAVIISVLDYLIERVFKLEATPFGNGLKGFVVSAIILYAAQFIVPDMRVTLWGAIIGALVIGILDAIFPNRAL